jgi:D-ribose pyranose/furanose isomerase RbsD
MTDTTPFPPIPDRVERLEVDMLDVKVSLNQLIDVVFQGQQQLNTTMLAVDRLAQAQERTLEIVETMQAEIRDIQSEVRGIQTENRRIIQRVFGEEADDGEA